MIKKLLFAAAVATAFTASAEVVWTGSAPLDWNAGKALEIEASAFSNVQANDQIVAHFTMDAGVSYANMFFCIGEEGWPHMTNNDNRTNINSYNSYPPGTTESAVKVAAADVAGLKASGMALMGEKLTVTSVEIVSASDAPADNVWTGSEDLGNWGNLIIPVSYTKNLSGETKVDIYFTVGDRVENGSVYGKIMPKSDWNTNLEVTMTNVDSFDAFQPDVTNTSFTLSAAQTADVASKELILSGWNLTITKVVFNGDGSEGGNGGGGDTPSTDNNVWTGNENLGNWQNLIIDAKYCKNLQAGDKITIDFTVNAGNDYGNMAFKDGDWKEYQSLKETATNRDTYGTWQADVTMTVLTVDAEQAAAFASKGFIISGENVTITKVVFGEAATGSVNEIVVDNANAPVEYYNLQGIRVNQPAAGQIVIRRQGTDVQKIRF